MWLSVYKINIVSDTDVTFVLTSGNPPAVVRHLNLGAPDKGYPALGPAPGCYVFER